MQLLSSPLDFCNNVMLGTRLNQKPIFPLELMNIKVYI